MLWEKLTTEDLFEIANFLQTSSYVSLNTALSYYGITTQQIRNVIESIAIKLCRIFEIKDFEFRFTLIKKDLYFGFERQDNFFIATPEKAFFDIIYLESLGRYKTDYDAIDFKKLNLKQVTKFIKTSPLLTKRFFEKLCETYKL